MRDPFESYDKWKLDYPEHWDNETFICEHCGEEFDLQQRDNSLLVSDYCLKCSKELDSDN